MKILVLTVTLLLCCVLPGNAQLITADTTHFVWNKLIFKEYPKGAKWNVNPDIPYSDKQTEAYACSLLMSIDDDSFTDSLNIRKVYLIIGTTKAVTLVYEPSKYYSDNKKMVWQEHNPVEPADLKNGFTVIIFQ